MKILICLILLALIYFIYKKFFANNKPLDGEQISVDSKQESAVSLTNKSATDNSAAMTDGEMTERVTGEDVGNTDSEKGVVAAAVAATAAVATGAATAAVDSMTPSADSANSRTDSASASQSNSASAGKASTASSSDSVEINGGHSLPVEHLVGVDRRTGKALRAMGISDTLTLAAASAEKLQAAGLDTAATKTLQAQAALSALSGVTPHEASVLASCGIDSVATLAKQDPAELVAKLEKVNRYTGALKSAPGVQQLQRLISTANVAA